MNFFSKLRILRNKNSFRPTSSLDHKIPNKKEHDPTVLLIDGDVGLTDYGCYLAYGLSRYKNIILCGFSRESYRLTGAADQDSIEFYWMNKRLPKRYLFPVSEIAREVVLFWVLFNIFVKREYDIVHIQEDLPTFFLLIPILKLKKKKICWTLHDIKPFSPSKGIRGRLQLTFLKLVSQRGRVAKFSDVILVHAYSHKKYLETKISRNKIHVIPHFDYKYLLKNTNTKLRTSNDFKFPDGYVLFFGTLAPWKGIDILLEAAKVVSNKIESKFRLVIAGPSYYKDESILSMLSEEERRYIYPINRYIINSEIPDLLNNSKFLVVPYTNAFEYSASGVIPLAYTFSKPVIGSNVPSLAEYVDHGITGFIFEAGNSSQLAEYIIKLLNNSDTCIEMGKKAHQKILQHMSLENCCKQLNDLYDTLVNQGA